MKTIIGGQDDLIGPWVAERTGGEYTGAGVSLGLAEDGKLIAGVLYDSYNGANIHVSLAAEPGRRWLTREFLRVMFQYPFQQLAVKRITTFVPDTNADSMRFTEHLGFSREATLADAHPSGNIIIYVMHRKDCRWLTPEV